MTEREEFEAHFGGRYLGLQQDIAWAAWQAATAAERDRCAKAVDNWMRHADMTGDDIRKAS